MPIVAVMLDTIHNSVRNIPGNASFVAGYVSGTPDIQWTETDWSLFPHSHKIRIEQGFGQILAPDQFDVLDCERGALSPQQCADIIEERVLRGFQWTTVYGGDANLALVAAAVQAKGEYIWNGHVNVWYADWNLDQAEAAALVGTTVHSMTVVAVQWASPSSNPHTTVPGSNLTLSAANVDISAVDVDWVPSSAPPPVPVPVPVPVGGLKGYVVFQDSAGALSSHSVSSPDGGKTWS